LVFEAYRAGDGAAEAILQNNMRAVANLIEGAARRLPRRKEIPVVLCGGLTRDSDILLPLLTEALAHSDNHYYIRLCDRTMAQGALILAGLHQRKGEESLC
jgi:N-acetylglucosamine kinase-like BadF-type ATPase